MDQRDEVRGFLASRRARRERGQLAGAPEAARDAIAEALHLDEAEQLHLRNLTHAAP